MIFFDEVALNSILDKEIEELTVELKTSGGQKQICGNINTL